MCERENVSLLKQFSAFLVVALPVILVLGETIAFASLYIRSFDTTDCLP